MPATRKSSRLSGGAGGKQSTLSFNHRVTKSVPKSAKDAAARKPTAPSKVAMPELETAAKELPTTPVKEAEPEVQENSEAERKAAKVTAKEIDRYWRKIEDARMAKATHQKHTAGLTTGEKVLRYFDVSSQYGPCIGITRLKRWQRAERLSLNPPIEVLAVLLKEEAAGKKANERAHVDELLNLAAVDA